MNKIQLELPWKHAKFTAEALEFRIKAYEDVLQLGDTSDDEHSDIQNDMPLYKSILAELQEKLAQHEKNMSSTQD